MDPKHQDLIRANYTKLIDILRGDVENVCNFLYQKEIINVSMKEKTLCQKTPGRQSSYLLDLLVNRGARAFKALYEACKLNNLKDAADILRPDKAPHKSSTATGSGSIVDISEQEEEQSLPAMWPTEEHFKRVKNKVLHVKKVSRDKKSAMLEKYQTHLNTDTIYTMTHRVRGNALIILNNTFTMTKLERREGSEWDKEGLEQLFKGLGFRVTLKEDLTKDLINKAIDEEIYTDHSKHDCFVFFIMSHGNQGEIYDTKKVPVSMNSMIDKFNAIDDLKTKPKLLFFQACQGDDFHRGISAVAQVQDEDDETLTRHDGAEANNTEIPSIPMYEDVFVFRSSPDGARSFRNKLWGSWFTQAVIYVFSEFAHKCDLCDLQLKVNHLLSRGETQKGKYKNVGEFVFVPGKRFYFFPGLYDQ